MPMYGHADDVPTTYRLVLRGLYIQIEDGVYCADCVFVLQSNTPNIESQNTHLCDHKIRSRDIESNQLLSVHLLTDLRVSSLQCLLASPAESRSTPLSCRSLLLRSISLKLKLELRTDDNSLQHLSERLQPLSLKRTHTQTQTHAHAHAHAHAHTQRQ